MHFEHSYLPFYTDIPHLCSLLKNLSLIVLSICFVFWPIEITHGHLCHCGFGATHWSLVSSAMILCLPESIPNFILWLILCSFPSVFSFISLIIFGLLKAFISLLGEFHTQELYLISMHPLPSAPLMSHSNSLSNSRCLL